MSDLLEGGGKRRPLWPWLFVAIGLAAAVASFFAYVPR
jgi:hypothetical protein